MSARRGLLSLAALVTATMLAGCAATVTGNGSLAAGAQTPSTDDPTDEPTDGPSDDVTDEPTDGSTDTSPTSIPTGGTSAKGMCALLSPAELQQMFGEPVTTEDRGDEDSCEFTTATGSIGVDVYNFLNMEEEKQSENAGKNITVLGQPAYQVENRRVLVARSKDATAPGLIVASNLYFNEETKGMTILFALLKKVVPAYPK